MKKIILIITLLEGTVVCFAQQPTTATTDDGRKILLYPDGTWRLLKKAAGEPGTTRTYTYQKPAEAKLFVKTPKRPFGVWVNQQKWTQDAPVDEDAKIAQITLNHKKGFGYAMIVAEGVSIPTKTLKERVMENARKAAPDLQMLLDETRIVNGKEILCMKWSETIEKINFIYLGYYYGGPEGSLQVITYTASPNFEEFKSDFEEFLNGTQIGQ